MSPVKTEPCPCGSSRDYAVCCGALHRCFRETGLLEAHDASTLMRSRYSAYVKDELAYLMASWHPRTRPESLEPNPVGLRWLGLEVQQFARQDETHATVRFVARSKLGGRAQRMVETSRFEKIDDQWLYVDGDLDP